MKNKFLIIGCGRSGTAYINELLNSLNIPSDHEKNLEESLVWVDWHNAININKIENQENNIIKIFHQVRNPVDCIASCLSISALGWKFITRNIELIKDEDPDIIKGMKYWLYWNEICERQSSYRYKIEDIDTEIEQIIRYINPNKLPINTEIVKNSNRKKNTRKHRILNRDNLKKANFELFKAIKLKAMEYGYEI